MRRARRPLGLILAALVLICARAARATVGAGTTAIDFLNLEQGTRGIGMGGAQVAVADDGGAAFWNPAGLARASMREFTVSDARLIASMSSQYIGLAWPVSPAIGAFGASFAYLNIPGLDGFDQNGNPAGKLTANYYAGQLSYARELAPHLTMGANFKMVGAKLATEAGQGFAADVGLQYRQNGVGVGVVVQNVGAAFPMANASQPLPLDVRAGVSYQAHPRLLLAFDEEKPRDDNYKLHLGGEWRVNAAFTLRAGFEQIPNVGSAAGYTAGLGYVMALGSSNGWAGEETPWWEKRVEESEKSARPEGAYLLYFDYAYVSYGSFADTHRFTLGVRF